MTLYIGHISALQYLLTHRSDSGDAESSAALEPTRAQPKAGGSPSAQRLRTIDVPAGICCTKLHVNVCSTEDRRSSKAISAHVWKGPKRGTYLHINDEFCVLTPEACFLQLANDLSFPQLVELGYLLCGTYLPNCVPASKHNDLSPLTNPAKLGRYVARSRTCKGSAKARFALQFVQAGSASTMESKIATALTLPTTRGGEQARALLNAEIELSDRARGFDWANTRRPDFFWPDKGVALDYDSTEWHDETARADHDARRHNELSAMGINSLVCRAKDFRNLTGMQQLFGQVRAALGIRKPRAKDYARNQEVLFEQLFGKGKWEVMDEIPRAKPRTVRDPSTAKSPAEED